MTLLLVLGTLVVAGWYLTFSATRLDRLHARLEGARSALDAQLVRRASIALQIAASGRLDPATGLLLADAAHRAREADTGDDASGDPGDDSAREVAESDLTRALHAAFADPAAVAEFSADDLSRELLHELGSACQRAALARRFHNDVVRAARVVRRKWVVRLLRLAGHAPWPATFEINDTPPQTLSAPGGDTTYRRVP